MEFWVRGPSKKQVIFIVTKVTFIEINVYTFYNSLAGMKKKRCRYIKIYE